MALEFGEGSRIKIPIAVLIWLMIYPMMLRVDFGSTAHIGRRPKGLLVTRFVNWLVKPFSMALFGWPFFRHAFLILDRSRELAVATAIALYGAGSGAALAAVVGCWWRSR